MLTFAIACGCLAHSASGHEIEIPIDPTFGNTIKGGTALTLSQNVPLVGTTENIWSCKFTMPEDGDVESITTWIYYTYTGAGYSVNIKCAIYDDVSGPQNVIASTEDNAIPAGYNNWVTTNFASPPTLSENASYWLTVWGEASSLEGYYVYIYADAGDTNQSASKAVTYNGFPDPLTGEMFSDYNVSIYCYYGTAEKSDGYARKTGTSYPPTTYLATPTGPILVGQNYYAPTYYVYNGYVSFDTSAIPDDKIIISAELRLKTDDDQSIVDFDVRVYGNTQPLWGTSFNESDWGCGTNLQFSWNTAGYVDEVYINFTIDPAQINKAGRTQFEVRSSRYDNLNAPSGEEYVSFHDAEDGISDAPKLVVEWDSEAPTYSNLGKNSTRAETECLFYMLWDDNLELSGFIYSWNGSGSWVNDTWASLSGTSDWANVTKTLPSSGTVGWIVYCNDTSDNWGDTGIQSFTVVVSLSLSIQTKDYEANVLTSAVVFMNNGTWYNKTVDSDAWANFTVDSDVGTVDVYAIWYGTTVNQSHSVAISGNMTHELNCTAYPFVYSGTRYHVTSDANISSTSFISNQLTVAFSSNESTYFMIANGPRPTYILNTTYDLATDYTTYLNVTHYSNATIVVDYSNWGTTYIQDTNRLIVEVQLVGQKLYITSTGQTGETGQLGIYCGSRGSPAETNGFTSTNYSSSTTIFVGSYIFNSNKMVWVNWASGYVGPGPGGIAVEPIVLDFPKISIVEPLTVGDVRYVDVKIEYRSARAVLLFVTNVTFGDYASWFSVEEDLPIRVIKLTDEPEFIKVSIRVMVPRGAEPREYQVPCEVTILQEASEHVAMSYITFTVVKSELNIPELMPYLFLAMIAVLLVSTLRWKKKR